MIAWNKDYPNGDWLSVQAQQLPDQVALIDNRPLINWHSTWDYRALDLATGDLSRQLAAAGVREGERVGMLLPSLPASVMFVFALARLGAVLVPLNLRLAVGEIERQISQASCAFLVACDRTVSIIEKFTNTYVQSGLPLASFNLQDEKQDEQLYLFRTRMASAYQVPMAQPGVEQTAPWSSQSIQSIIFTSGTTGHPKGAQLTFGNHYWSALGSYERLGALPNERWLLTLPLYHVGGLAIILRSCLYGTAFVLQENFQPAAILDAISRHKVTIISLVPTMLYRLLEIEGAGRILADLRCILLGGAATPGPLLEKALSGGLPIALTYGMTETASQIATATPDEVRQRARFMSSGQITQTVGIGKPLSCCKVHILDENNQELPAFEIGQIAVEGPVVMPGYIQVDPPDQPFTEDGALLTGDLGMLDDQGDLWVLQRRHDLIISGGENVYPMEVEQVLLQHPAVQDVCVIGLDDVEWGQLVAAAVVLKADSSTSSFSTQNQAEQALREYCRSHLAGYKTPRRIFFLDQLPQTDSGKVIRKQVVALLDDLQREIRPQV